MHPTLAEGVDDMIDLGEMSEAGLLRNLMLRHKRGVIYVRRETEFCPCVQNKPLLYQTHQLLPFSLP